jgi:putative NADPH-quinone reductase
MAPLLGLVHSPAGDALCASSGQDPVGANAMPKSVCIIQGHPYSDGKRLCHALAMSYARGARSKGAKVETIDLGAMEVSLLRNPDDFKSAPPRPIKEAQEAVTRCEHLAVIYPLWLGTMPALVKAFFEQLSRNDFAISEGSGAWPRQMLKGRSARVIVTMGMPAAAYRLVFGAHGVKGFESGILAMSGFKPVNDTLIGGVFDISKKRAMALFARMEQLGAKDVAVSRRAARAA